MKARSRTAANIVGSYVSVGNPVPQTKDPSTPTLITTAIAVASFAFIYLSQRQQLSIIEQILFGLLLLLLLAALINWLWSPSIAKVLCSVRANRIARRNMREFRLYVEEFSETYTRLVPNITSPLTDLRSRASTAEFSKIPNANPMYLYNLCEQFIRGLDLMRGNQATLSWGTQTFGGILRTFNDSLIAPAVTEIRTISDKVGIPRDIKENYNTYRLKYIGFLDKYEGFIVRVNKEFGSTSKKTAALGTILFAPLMHPYIERPKEL